MRTTPWIAFTLALAASFASAVAENVDPADDGSGQYAWTENHGWINAEPSGNGGPGVQVGDFGLTGWMWSENLGWISLSCQNTASCPSNSYGAQNDGVGNLSGYVWAENAGWISLSCENNNSCGTASYGVTVDSTSGQFSGYAWGENAGWVSFSCDTTSSCGAVAYGVSTDWCAAVTAAPTGVPTLTFTGGFGSLSWSAVADATFYEVVLGDLNLLRATGGDFATATSVCIGENLTGTSHSYIGFPLPGEGHTFLVRAANCKGKGSYNSSGLAQVGSRDAGVVASGVDCP